MQPGPIIDQLETEFGTAILCDLTGERLTRNGQPVRLFDQTKHTSEVYYKLGKKGKPYIHNFQEDKSWFPFTAYREVYGLDTATALRDLQNQYGTGATTHRPARVRPRPPQPEPEPLTIIPVEVYQGCQIQFERNGLFLYLRSFFEDETTAYRIIEQYCIGTSRHGSTPEVWQRPYPSSTKPDICDR